MPPRRVIGIDAGGTKLLGGVVDEDLVVHHRVHRTWRGADRQETLDIIVDAVEEVAAAAPGRGRRGLRHPRAGGLGDGRFALVTHLPLEDVPFRDLMSERLGLPVEVDNDSNAALLAEHRAGAARGARHAALIALGTGIGGGLLLDGRIYRGADGFGAELGPHGGRPRRPRLPGRLPRARLPRGAGVRNGDRRGGAARSRRSEPDSELGRRRGRGAEITGAARHRARARRRRAGALAVLAEVGRAAGRRDHELVNALNPEVVVIGGGAVAAGTCCSTPPARSSPSARCRRSRERVRIVPAHFGGESGMLGAALLALEAPAGHERAARRLPDADRQPRGRDPARAGRAARGRRRRLRGHAAHAHAARPLRRQRQARLLPRAQRASARAAELVERMRAGRRWRSSPTPGCRSSRTPATCWCGPAWRPGCPSRSCRGRPRRSRRWWPRALPADEWRFAGFLPRKKGELRALLGEPGGTLVAFESPRRVPATLALLAELDPDREVAVCRELTKVHEEVVRGTAAELAARYAGKPPKGEVVLVLGAAARASGRRAGEPPRLDALRGLVEAGAQPRKAAAVVAELTGGSANELYRALTAGD